MCVIGNRICPNNCNLNKYSGFLGKILPENAVSVFLEKMEKRYPKRRLRADLFSLSYYGRVIDWSRQILINNMNSYIK